MSHTGKELEHWRRLLQQRLKKAGLAQVARELRVRREVLWTLAYEEALPAKWLMERIQVLYSETGFVCPLADGMTPRRCAEHHALAWLKNTDRNPESERRLDLCRRCSVRTRNKTKEAIYDTVHQS